MTWVSPQGLPGVIRHVPGWLLDPLGPVAVRWPYLPRLVPWFAAMWRHSRHSEVARIGDALAALMGVAWPAWDRLLGELGLHHLVQHGGSLTAYHDRAALERDHLAWDMRRQHGFDVDTVAGDALRRAEPHLSKEFGVGVVEPRALWCTDPMAVIDGMVDLFTRQGGEFVTGDVTALVASGNRVTAVRTPGAIRSVDAVVVAAGAWSHRLSRQLGSRVPLESERGYHVDLPQPGITLTRILALAPHKMVATPMRSGLRLSGTAEFAGVNSAPAYRRARALLTHGAAALPGLDTTGYTEWAGDRPILPDSLPVIGQDPHHANVHYAFGHSHIGFTLGPATGEIVADVVTGERPAVDITPFRIDRFGRRT